MQPTLAKAQGRNETQIEIAAQSFAAYDANGKTRCLCGLQIVNIDVSGGGDAVVSVGPGVGRLRDVLVALNRFDGVTHLVESQQETEMVRLLFVFRQVVDDSALGLCWND